MRGRCGVRRGGALTTNLRASAGSGQGGKAEKAQARKDKEAARKERERARKEREKERARKQKDKAQRDKERAKAQRDKERAKAAADKLKERKLKLKEKEAKVKKPRTTSSLHPPKAPQNAWGIFLGDFIAEKKRSLAEGEKLPSVSILVKDATPQYQALSAEDKAALHERSEEQRRAYPDILNAWKATLTPDMIKEENAVRARRRKLGLSHKANLRLEGEPKKPVTAYILFSQEVRARGVDSDVLQGETDILEQSKLMAQAWRALSDEEKKNQWPAPTSYPCIASTFHAVIGEVVRIGDNVKHLKLGQRVGVGAQAGSCLECDACKAGLQQHCEKGMVGTYNSKWEDGTVSQGGYADHTRVKGALAVPIPDGLEPEPTAPLLCAGVTVYSPLKRFGAGPGKKVGIVGIGGLGHLALQIASAMGAETYALSHSASKIEDAEKLGVKRDNFIIAKDAKETAKAWANTFDIILITAPSDNLPLDSLYFPMMKRLGAVILCALPESKLPPFFAHALVGKSLTLAGSLIGGTSEIAELFDLAAKHGIKAWTETRPMSQTSQTLQDMEAGKARYRFVLSNTKQ
ncbi:NADP-dependent alcohol dehydrogenase [Rhodotorula diobovata]|uniref:NADP-dependent alcohol dehydrogenase n=1 Tax=Rhodotorula diobovata TaxID=5288 RepID=A0A5C5G4D0_9BASI|nr:NADP-dependent alcohol dehydrogenase [Rhodotorula diobovata]